MPHTSRLEHYRREVSRIEGFSDAVFAFAICFTLLFQLWWRHFNFFRRYGLEDAPTIALTAVLLFVVLFYVYPLKFVFKLVIDRLLGFHADTPGEPIITVSQTPVLRQIYSGGVIAVFTVFALLYANAYRKRAELELNERLLLDTRVNIIDNAGIALIGVVSVAIATFGGPWAAAAISGPIYFLIGPFKWWPGWYRAAEDKRLA